MDLQIEFPSPNDQVEPALARCAHLRRLGAAFFQEDRRSPARPGPVTALTTGSAADSSEVRPCIPKFGYRKKSPAVTPTVQSPQRGRAISSNDRLSCRPPSLGRSPPVRPPPGRFSSSAFEPYLVFGFIGSLPNVRGQPRADGRTSRSFE